MSKLNQSKHAKMKEICSPDNSFIIFGNGEKIRLGEIADWQIPNIDLIILSACQTGVDKLGDGVEILGFGYQVQRAGAKNEIASLWFVNDEGTQALMEAFYREPKYRTKSLKCFPSNGFKQNIYNPYWTRVSGSFAILFLIFCPVLRGFIQIIFSLVFPYGWKC